MFRLPPPPRFTLPPPPMPPAGFFDTKFMFRPTCSSMQQHQHLTNPRLILISSITFFVIALLSTLLLVLIQLYRRRGRSSSHAPSKASSTPVTTSVASTMARCRSYETISSRYTGIYLESIDTSATTYSTDPSHTICLHCQHEHDHPAALIPPPYYHTLDILPS